MLELGWSTPSLVTVRLGLLVEASQFVILGQAIVQLPPHGQRRSGAPVPAPGFRWLGSIRSLANWFRRQAGELARRLHFHHRPVRLPRRVRRQPDLHHQRRRLSSALQGNPVRHSRAVRARRRQLRHRHRRHLVQGLFRHHLGHRAGRLRSAHVGRRSESPASRAGGASTQSVICSPSSISRSICTRTWRCMCSAWISPPSTSMACWPGPDAGISPAAPRCIRRGRCRISACTSTRPGARIATHRWSRSGLPTSWPRKSARLPTGARNCRRAAMVI